MRHGRLSVLSSAWKAEQCKRSMYRKNQFSFLKPNLVGQEAFRLSSAVTP
jgi:hypothetical protein